jgi:hypothetical protein
MGTIDAVWHEHLAALGATATVGHDQEYAMVRKW